MLRGISRTLAPTVFARFSTFGTVAAGNRGLHAGRDLLRPIGEECRSATVPMSVNIALSERFDRYASPQAGRAAVAEMDPQHTQSVLAAVLIMHAASPLIAGFEQFLVSSRISRKYRKKVENTPGQRDQARAGRSRSKRVPVLGMLLTAIRPWCSSKMRRAMASPKPDPLRSSPCSLRRTW